MTTIDAQTLAAIRERYRVGPVIAGIGQRTQGGDPAVVALIDTLIAERAQHAALKIEHTSILAAWGNQAATITDLQQKHAALVARIRDIKVQSDEEDRRVVTPHGSSFGRCKHDAAALAALVAEVGEQ